MLRVGIVGIGFMGWMHYLAYQRVKGVKLTAICARDPRKLAGDWRGIQGNFGPRGEQVDLTHVGAYTEIEGLLHDPDVDLVDVCLPPDLHTDVTLRALAAGKHVLVEKPMAASAAQAATLVDEAERRGLVLMVDHTFVYTGAVRKIRELVAAGELGRVLYFDSVRINLGLFQPDYNVICWHGMFFPAGTPAEIVRRVNGELLKALATPEAKRYMADNDYFPTGTTPEELQAFVREDLVLQAKFAKMVGIQPQ